MSILERMLWVATCQLLVKQSAWLSLKTYMAAMIVENEGRVRMISELRAEQAELLRVMGGA